MLYKRLKAGDTSVKVVKLGTGEEVEDAYVKHADEKDVNRGLILFKFMEDEFDMEFKDDEMDKEVSGTTPSNNNKKKKKKKTKAEGEDEEEMEENISDSTGNEKKMDKEMEEKDAIRNELKEDAEKFVEDDFNSRVPISDELTNAEMAMQMEDVIQAIKFAEMDDSKKKKILAALNLTPGMMINYASAISVGSVAGAGTEIRVGSMPHSLTMNDGMFGSYMMLMPADAQDGMWKTGIIHMRPNNEVYIEWQQLLTYSGDINTKMDYEFALIKQGLELMNRTFVIIRDITLDGATISTVDKYIKPDQHAVDYTTVDESTDVPSATTEAFLNEMRSLRPDNKDSIKNTRDGVYIITDKHIGGYQIRQMERAIDFWDRDVTAYIKTRQKYTDKVLNFDREVSDEYRVKAPRLFESGNYAPLYTGFPIFIMEHIKSVEIEIMNVEELIYSVNGMLASSINQAVQSRRFDDTEVNKISNQFTATNTMGLTTIISSCLTSDVNKMKLLVSDQIINWADIIGFMVLSMLIPEECVHDDTVLAGWNTIVAQLTGDRQTDAYTTIDQIKTIYNTALPASFVTMMDNGFARRKMEMSSIDADMSIDGQSAQLAGFTSILGITPSEAYRRTKQVITDFATMRATSQTKKRTLRSVVTAMGIAYGDRLTNMDATFRRMERVYQIHNDSPLSMNRNQIQVETTRQYVDLRCGLTFNALTRVIVNSTPILRDFNGMYMSLQARAVSLSIIRIVWQKLLYIKQAFNIRISDGELIRTLSKLVGSVSPTINGILVNYSSSGGSLDQNVLNILEGPVDPFINDMLTDSIETVGNYPQRFGLYNGDIYLAEPTITTAGAYNVLGSLRYAELDTDNVISVTREQLYEEYLFDSYRRNNQRRTILLKDYVGRFYYNVNSGPQVKEVPQKLTHRTREEIRNNGWQMIDAICSYGFKDESVVTQRFLQETTATWVSYIKDEVFDPFELIDSLLQYVRLVKPVLEPITMVDLNADLPLSYLRDGSS
jgi:hypothetical protein